MLKKKTTGKSEVSAKSDKEVKAKPKPAKSADREVVRLKSSRNLAVLRDGSKEFEAKYYPSRRGEPRVGVSKVSVPLSDWLSGKADL